MLQDLTMLISQCMQSPCSPNVYTCPTRFARPAARDQRKPALVHIRRVAHGENVRNHSQQQVRHDTLPATHARGCGVCPALPARRPPAARSVRPSRRSVFLAQGPACPPQASGNTAAQSKPSAKLGRPNLKQLNLEETMRN